MTKTVTHKSCARCDGQGWYWRTPDGFNPFLAGGFQTARAMYKVTCNCAAVPPSPQPNLRGQNFETPTPPGNQIRTAECDGKDAVPVTGQLPVGTASPQSHVDGWTPPQDCDGKEQLAFEAWASGERYDMHEHPLHYLFMDKKTNAARQGWKAALRYVREQHALATTEGKP